MARPLSPVAAGLGPWGIPVTQVVVWEAAALGAAVALATTRDRVRIAVIVAAALLGLGLLAATAVRVHGRWGYQWLTAFLRSGREVPSQVVDPLLDLELTDVHDRAGLTYGLARDGESWVAVLSLATAGDHGGELVQPAGGDVRLPWEVLTSALDDRGVRLAAVQLVRLGVPPVASGSASADRAAPLLDSYRTLAGQAPARQRRYLALRLRPGDCPNAVAARGGGDEGARRALVSALARARYHLGRNGIDATPLAADELALAVRTVLGPPPGPDPSARGPRWGAERRGWRAWQSGGTAHVTFVVRRWPTPGTDGPLGDRPADLLTDLAGVPATACVTALTVRPGRHPGTPAAMSAVVRYLCPATERDRLRGDVLASARASGARVAPADGAHLRGVRSTLPLALVGGR